MEEDYEIPPGKLVRPVIAQLSQSDRLKWLARWRGDAKCQNELPYFEALCIKEELLRILD